MANKEKLHSIPLAALVLFILIFGSSVALAGTETRLTNDALLTQKTSIYGNIITWSETAGNGVHVYDLATGKEINVGAAWAGKIPIYGNKIVWADMDQNIRVYDISINNVTKIASDGNFPDIYGNYIVYTNYYSSQDHKNDSIYLYDLNSHNETKIAAVNSYPVIYDKTVVWSQANSNSGYNICKYDIPANQTSTITTTNSYVSELDIYGNTVVWAESDNVYMYDIASHKKTQITNTGNAYEPAIYGNRIVYTNDPRGIVSGDIYMYEISTAKTTRITTSTSAFGPSIYKDKIVYADSKNSEYGDLRDVYLYDLSSTVQKPPVAKFTSNVTSGITPLVVLFTDTSTGGEPTSWLWDFGDGIDSKHAMNATHTFTKPGNYTISLTAGNDAGNNKVMKPNYIVVTNQFPVANFNNNVTDGYPPLSIQFTDLSKNATGWNWDFGDGSNSTKRSPVHEYTDPGIYSVNLTASNENGTDSRLTTITVMQLVGVGPYAYITNSGDNTVSVIDTATNKVTAIIPVGDYPLGVAITLDGKKVYVTNGPSNNISVIDATKNKVTATIPLKNPPRGVAISPDGKRLYLPHYDGNPSNNTILIIDTVTNEITDAVLVGEIPFGVAVTLDGKKVYVTNFDGKTVSVIDTATNTAIATVPVGNNPRGVAVTPDGSNVYVACDEGNNNGYIYVIDAVKNKVTATVLVGSLPYVVAVTPDGKRVYVTNGLSKTVSVIDAATNKVTATIPVGNGPSGVAVTPDGSKVYVTNIGDNNVSVIDTSTDKVIATMNVGHSPNSFGQFIGSLQAQSIFPVADFNSNVTEGYAPLKVQFNDLSQKVTSRIWDFNGDGQPDSNDINPVYVYANAGIYTVNLTVSNENVTASKTAAINVLTPSSSSGGSSSGSSHSSSSGGGGGSLEPQSNVQVKELSQAFITNGKTVKFVFPMNETCVVNVSFDAKKTFGKTATIAEQLKGKSALVSKLPSGEVYKSFNVWVGNGGIATSRNIENPVVCFKIEKAWIKDKKIEQDSITLNRYNDNKWEQFPVNFSGDDDKFLYLIAKTSGFSSFAITGTAKQSEETVKGIQLASNGTSNENNTENKEPQNQQNEILKTPGFEVYYEIAGLLAVLLYKRSKKSKI